MGRRRQGPKKSKWDKLPTGFKEAVEQMSTKEIKDRLGDITLLKSKDEEMFKQDPEVAQAKERLKHLSSPFRENIASYKLQIEWCRRTLNDKDGGATAARAEENAKAKPAADGNPLVLDMGSGDAPN